MGLSGDEREFLQRLLDMPDGVGFQVGTRYYAKVHFSTILTEGEKVIQSLIRRGYCSSTHDPLMAKITEAGAAAMNAEKRAEKAFKDGMAGGKKIQSNAVNRLRAKLADQQIPTMLNKIYKLLIKRTDLTAEERALLEEGKTVLTGTTRPSQDTDIIINGHHVPSPLNLLSYDDILALAGCSDTVIDGGGVSVIVTMTPKDQGPRIFTLAPGQNFFREPGSNVVINAVRTDGA